MMGYPEMDDIELNDAIAQALFIADLMGRWEAQQDIGNGKA
jgi:phage gp29-like protein